MSTIVTMSQTVGDLTSGQTYRVRARYAETLIAATQAIKSATKGPAANIAGSKNGKH